MLSLVAGAVLGLLLGSFLNVVIYRLPLMLERDWRRQAESLAALPADGPAAMPEEPFNLLTPRSRCPGCGAPVRAVHNVPVLSWLWLRGRCAACGMRIPARYPVVELATGVLSAGVLWHFGINPWGAAALLFTWALIALTVIDLDHQLLPDAITYPLLWLGLLVSAFGATQPDNPFPALPSAVIGAAAGYLLLWSVYWVFRLLTGKEGMGYGDFKLLAALGAWLGYELLPLVILLAALVGAVTGLALIAVRGRDRQLPLPFGPYLAGAGLIALVWGQDIVIAYLRLAGL